jgi:N utilization substance protein A
MKLDTFKILDEIKKNKDLEVNAVLNILKEIIYPIYKKKFGENINLDVEIDENNKSIKIYLEKQVVKNVENSEYEISEKDAQKINLKNKTKNTIKIGDKIKIVTQPEELTRIVTQNAKRNFLQEIRKNEMEKILHKYSKYVNNLVTGKVRKINQKNILLEIGDIETLLIPSEQVKKDNYEPGKQYKFYVTEVSNTLRGLNIIVSRSHPELIRKLFEFEIPEIKEGIVVIKLIAREAGSRSKIAVYSNDPNIDPIGTCIGSRGTRIQNIVNELRGEKIDIIKYTDKINEFILESLKPAETTMESIDEKNKLCKVKVQKNQISLAIGKEGQNVRLAAKITGFKIDISSIN